MIPRTVALTFIAAALLLPAAAAETVPLTVGSQEFDAHVNAGRVDASTEPVTDVAPIRVPTYVSNPFATAVSELSAHDGGTALGESVAAALPAGLREHALLVVRAENAETAVPFFPSESVGVDFGPRQDREIHPTGSGANESYHGRADMDSHHGPAAHARAIAETTVTESMTPVASPRAYVAPMPRGAATDPIPYEPAPPAPPAGPVHARDGATVASAGVAPRAPFAAGDASAPAKAAAVAAAVIVPVAFAVAALYNRIRGHSTLDSARRKVIFEAVCREPGLGVPEASRIAGVSYSTASYHLDRLIEEGLVVMSQRGKKRHYFQNGGAFNEDERHLVPLLKNEEAMRVLDVIIATPGTYRAKIAEALGVTHTTVNWHMKRLLDLRLVVEHRAGRNARLVVDTARLATVIPTLAQKLDEPEPAMAALARGLLARAAAQPA